jgi:hypothetical protein
MTQSKNLVPGSPGGTPALFGMDPSFVATLGRFAAQNKGLFEGCRWLAKIHRPLIESDAIRQIAEQVKSLSEIGKTLGVIVVAPAFLGQFGRRNDEHQDDDPSNDWNGGVEAVGFRTPPPSLYREGGPAAMVRRRT